MVHLCTVVCQGAFVQDSLAKVSKENSLRSLVKVHLCTVVCQGAFVQDSLAKVSKENTLKKSGQGSLTYVL
jgi:hypothetical protein